MWMKEGITQDPRHKVIDLSNDDGCLPDGIHADLQAHEAVLIGRRRLNQGYVDTGEAAAEKTRRF